MRCALLILLGLVIGAAELTQEQQDAWAKAVAESEAIRERNKAAAPPATSPANDPAGKQEKKYRRIPTEELERDDRMRVAAEAKAADDAFAGIGVARRVEYNDIPGILDAIVGQPAADSFAGLYFRMSWSGKVEGRPDMVDRDFSYRLNGSTFTYVDGRGIINGPSMFPTKVFPGGFIVNDPGRRLFVFRQTNTVNIYAVYSFPQQGDLIIGEGRGELCALAK